MSTLFQLDKRLGLSKQFPDLILGSGYRKRSNLQNILTRSALPTYPTQNTQQNSSHSHSPLISDQPSPRRKRGRPTIFKNNAESKRHREQLLLKQGKSIPDERIQGYFRCGLCSFCKCMGNDQPLCIKSVTLNGKITNIRGHISCLSENTIYAVINRGKNRFYIGSTKRQFRFRALEHWRNITGYHERGRGEKLVPEWILDVKEQWFDHSLLNVQFVPLISFDKKLLPQVLRQQEEVWIKSLCPQYNSMCNDVKWSSCLKSRIYNHHATSPERIHLKNVPVLKVPAEKTETKMSKKTPNEGHGKLLRSGRFIPIV
jgi:hypothetical protein